MNKFSTGYIFLKCMPVIFKNEGGYVWDKDDPGGETNMGICRMFYPDLDIRNLTKEQATDIYFNDYWLKMNIAGIHDENLVLQIFDMGINAGIRTAIKIIQRFVHVEVDGRIGPVTIKAINDSQDRLVMLYKEERKKYYSDLVRRKPTMQKFLKGWIKRVDTTKFS